MDKIKNYFSNYFKRKSTFAIISDAVFIVLIALLLIPATRGKVAAFFIKLTSLPPSVLDSGEQYSTSNESSNWIIRDKNGKTAVFSDFYDKPIFVNVWATWCPPCIAELPGIAEIQEEFGNDVHFILVTNEDQNTVNKFIEKNNYQNLNIYFSGRLPHDFETSSIPATFILDKNQKIIVNKKGAARWNSSSTKDLLTKIINE